MTRRWSEVHPDPISVEAKRWRVARLARVRSPRPIADRIEHLCALARGRKVLDIGCVAHLHEASEDPQWLHGHLARAAASCLGIDILPEPLKLLGARGYNVRLVDILEAPLEERFGVVVCGEVIEHVGDAGRLFRHVASMLEPDGVLALTTPFPWYFGWMVKNALNLRPAACSVDHVAWFDPCTLAELAERHGLRLRFYAGIRDQDSSWFLRVVKLCLRPLTWIGLRPEVLTRSILYEFVLDSPAREPAPGPLP